MNNSEVFTHNQKEVRVVTYKGLGALARPQTLAGSGQVGNFNRGKCGELRGVSPFLGRHFASSWCLTLAQSLTASNKIFFILESL